MSQSARSSCVWGRQAGSPRTCPHTAPPRPHAKPTPETGQESQSQGLPTTHVLPNLTCLLCLRGRPGRIQTLGHTPATREDRSLTLPVLPRSLLTGSQGPLQRSIRSITVRAQPTEALHSLNLLLTKVLAFYRAWPPAPLLLGSRQEFCLISSGFFLLAKWSRLGL